MIERTVENLKQYIGKYVLRENREYKWMFKIVSVENCDRIQVTEALDIFPKPRAYKQGIKGFRNVGLENIGTRSEYIMRLPTKEEMNTYRQFWRKIIYLGHL